MAETKSAQASEKIARVKAPQKPDDDAYKKSLEEINNTIAKLRKRLDDIKDKVGTSGGRNNVNEKRTELRNKLAELRDKQAGIKKGKESILEQIRTLTSSMQKKINEMKASKDKLPFKSLKEIDARISELEGKVTSGQLKLIEEKKYVSEISSLKKSRKTFETFQSQQEAIDADKKAIDELRRTMDDNQSRALNAEYNEIKAQLEAIDKEQNAEWSKRRELFDERDKIKAEINAEFDKRRALQDEHKRALDAYFNHVREERERRREQARERQRQIEEEKRAAAAEKERELAEIPAFSEEIIACDSLLQFLQTYTLDGANSKAPSAAAAATSSSLRKPEEGNLPEGVALKKKSERDDDYFVGGRGKKGGRNTQQKEKKPEQPSLLKLPLSIMERFWEIKVDVPVSVNDIEKSIEAIKAKKQWYLDNQQKVTEENKRRAEEKIAKLTSAMATASTTENGNVAAKAAEGEGEEKKQNGDN
ncbi:uncharacterized protein VTP21DRAFT_980 [Calcarisporiella thermophila]|uniref:uncharacterized protein n=1 Tax=Calcarisporiella thermophila TaxID=911321 RepID=UPI0037430F7F